MRIMKDEGLREKRDKRTLPEKIQRVAELASLWKSLVQLVDTYPS